VPPISANAGTDAGLSGYLRSAARCSDSGAGSESPKGLPEAWTGHRSDVGSATDVSRICVSDFFYNFWIGIFGKCGTLRQAREFNFGGPILLRGPYPRWVGRTTPRRRSCSDASGLPVCLLNTQFIDAASDCRRLLQKGDRQPGTSARRLRRRLQLILRRIPYEEDRTGRRDVLYSD
jgi:hypothetical protein